MTIDGKKIAEDALGTLLLERPVLGNLKLGVLMGARSAVTDSYVAIKARVGERLGVELVRIELGPTSDTQEAVYAVEELVKNTNGVVVQLPFPAAIDLEAVLSAIPESHDVDAVNPNAPPRLVRPPVAEAISEIFMRTGVVALGKKTVVVGAGRLVGEPAAQLLRTLGAEVEVVTKNDGNLLSLKNADIVVLGAGDPYFCTPEMLKEGVVLIDAGTSESSGKVVGDATPECAKVASVFTPVPGGVGPIAIAMLYKNLFVLAKAQK